MVNAQLDLLELELRKLDGVRTVGFSSQHDVLYIQLFVQADAPTATLPFQATRIAQRHSSSPVAVEIVRWTNFARPEPQPSGSGLASIFADTSVLDTPPEVPTIKSSSKAGSIGLPTESRSEPLTNHPEKNDVIVSEEVIQNEVEDSHDEEPPVEVDLTSEYDDALDRREDDPTLERIALLLVTTSSENDEIEVHLSFDDLRTIGRAATNRGLLGAIDATVQAIGELTGSDDFHAEWARSLEPGAEHASLVAVGLTNSEGTDTRHGIAGGSSPIEAAARATLNALNRTALLAVGEQ